MAGRPLSRERRAARELQRATLDQQRVRPARELVPKDVWRAWSEGERLEYLWARSLDDALELSCISWSDATAGEQMAKLRIFEGFLRLDYAIHRDQRAYETRKIKEIAAEESGAEKT